MEPFFEESSDSEEEDKAIMEYNQRQLVIVDKAPQLIFGPEFKVQVRRPAAPRGQHDDRAWKHGHCKGLTHEHRPTKKLKL